MCTAFVLITPGGAWPLRVAFVRDEDRSRPTSPPGRWWPDQPDIVGGRDERAGGTWLAVRDADDDPAVAFLLNRHEPQLDRPPPADSISRGTLPLLALAAPTFDATQLDLRRFEPFHLVLATRVGSTWWRWDGHALEQDQLAPGLHMIASRGLDLPGEIERRAMQTERFRAASLPDPHIDGDALTAWGDWLELLDGRDSRIDDPASVVVAGVSAYPKFGTVGASLVAIARNGLVRYDVNASHTLDPALWMHCNEPRASSTNEVPHMHTTSTPASPVATERDHLLPSGTRLRATRLAVTDLGRSVEWYERTLGLIERSRDSGVARLGSDGGPVVLELTEEPTAHRAGRHAGLFHVALLHPSRRELSLQLRRVIASRTEIQGATDHLTHEAIYLGDPDGNGLELAADRPRELWPARNGESQPAGISPLDTDDLLAMTLDAADAVPDHASGVHTGHLHLQVGAIDAGLAFYRDVIGFELQLLRGAAAFVSVDGYHHHLGFNTWQGDGVPAQPDGVVGLRHWSIELPSTTALDELVDRVRVAGTSVEHLDHGVLIRDPWNIPLLAQA